MKLRRLQWIALINAYAFESPLLWDRLPPPPPSYPLSPPLPEQLIHSMRKAANEVPPVRRDTEVRGDPKTD